MTPELFQKARTVFLAAKRLDETSRAALIEDVCDGDADLRRLVDRLLEADAARATSVLDEPVFKHPLARSVDELSTPKRLGPYRVLRSLGSGSVGDVYLAQREGEAGGPVAIKVLRAGSFSQSNMSAARFEVERNALSMLSHPHIARIYDAGCTDEGRAFIVMEYVRGQRIDEYCRLHGLSRKSRLTLFLQLCDAIQHAHQRGVIHRDLKPANVLVVDEPWPSVKVVDFGIAKIIGDPKRLSPTLTEPGQLLGTFAYMSPEQLDPARAQADARSDVYALGVLLYQLLTDRMPFEEDDLLARRAKAALNIAEIRPMVEVPGAARRDLETIVAKALHPDPDRRYATPTHLAEDVRRFLSGGAVQARGPSGWYRVTKVASRHPIAFTASVVACGAVAVIVLSNMLWRVEVERERQVARDSILNLMDSAVENIRHINGATRSRREMAQSLLLQTDRLLQFRPDDLELLECRARLLDELGDLALDGGDLREASERRDEALAILRDVSERSPQTVERRRRLAEAIVKAGDAKYAAGSAADAFGFYTEACEIHTALNGEYPSHVGVLDDLCWSHGRLAYTLDSLGRHEEAATHRERRLALSMRLLALSPERGLSHHNAARAHGAMATAAENIDEALSESYLAVSHAREAVELEPDRTAFQETLVYALRLRARAVFDAYGAEPAGTLIAEAVREVDRLQSSNPERRTFRDDRVQTRLWAAGLLLEALHADRSYALAQEALDLLDATSSEWDGARCAALRAMDDSVRRGALLATPTVAAASQPPSTEAEAWTPE